MAKSVHELLAERFGVVTTDRDNSELSQVGATAIRVLRSDPQRLGFTIINLSVNALHVGPFENVSATRGISVVPSGGSLSLVYDEDFALVAREWFAVAGGAGSDVLIIENIIEPDGVV